MAQTGSGGGQYTLSKNSAISVDIYLISLRPESIAIHINEWIRMPKKDSRG